MHYVRRFAATSGSSGLIALVGKHQGQQLAHESSSITSTRRKSVGTCTPEEPSGIVAAGTILHGQSEGGNRPRLGATPGRHDAVRLSRPPVRRQEYASSWEPGIYRIAHLF